MASTGKRKPALRRRASSAAHFTPVRSVRLHQVIIDQIRDLIRSGELLVGERFPSERELEEKWQVSRPVLREAFRVLEMQGIVDSRPGGGRYLRTAFVPEVMDLRQLKLEHNRETLLQYWEVREFIEVKAAELAARRATPEQIAAIGEPLAMMGKMTAEEYRMRDYNEEIHIAIARASGNPVIEEVIRHLMARLREVDFKRLLDINDWASLQREHQPIYDAIVARDPAAARRATTAHFKGLRRAIGAA